MWVYGIVEDKTMTDTFATVGFDSDASEWVVCYGDAETARCETKDAAIGEATSIETVNTVMAFTKGKSNMNTIRC